jgi:hypothetical protein
MGIAVKAGVLGNGGKDCAGIELVAIRETHGYALLIKVIRGGLRNQASRK